MNFLLVLILFLTVWKIFIFQTNPEILRLHRHSLHHRSRLLTRIYSIIIILVFMSIFCQRIRIILLLNLTFL